MLDAKGGETDRTAFFSVEVTFFFFSTVLKLSANVGLDLTEHSGIYCTCSPASQPTDAIKARIKASHRQQHQTTLNERNNFKYRWFETN